MGHGRRVVLVVDHDPSVRRLVRTGLELEGLTVIEAQTAGQVRQLLDQPLFAVVLDRELTDAAEVDLRRELTGLVPPERIVLHSAVGGTRPAGAVARGDLGAILAALDADPPAEEPESDPGEAAMSMPARLRTEWEELCQWDPEVPHGAQPALADSVIAAVSEAMERPQPLGWGLDPALESISQTFALNSAGVDVAVAQLVCLREAFERRLLDHLPAHARPEAARRLNMILHRMMAVVVRSGLAQLQDQALTDPLTGLFNRRAFDVDLERERSRARRHGRPLSVAMIDLDGLKRVNDGEGHAAGDLRLRSLAGALCRALRQEDSCYRLGGDEFAVIFPDSAVSGPDLLANRLSQAGAPPCSIGVASYPGDDLDRLPETADERLYEQRRRRPPDARRRDRAG